MEDNQNKTEETNLQPESTTPKTSIDYRLLAGAVILVLICLYVVLAMTAKMNKQDEVPADTMQIEPVAVVDPVDLPEDWLEEVPVTPDAAKTEVVEDFGLASSTVTFTTKQTEAEAIEFYKADIVAKGGVITSTLETADKKIIVANTADGSLYVVYIGVVAGETIITINIEPVQ